LSLPGEALEWVSDRQGHLGVGSQLSVTELEEGWHDIILIARDSRQHEGEQAVRILVGELPQLPPRVLLPLALKG
jgi:hypothetical protein